MGNTSANLTRSCGQKFLVLILSSLQMMAWYEGECQRAPQLSRRAAMQRLIAGFTGSLRRWWSKILTLAQRELMLSQDDPCVAVLDNLTLDFMGYGLREVQLTEK